MGLPVVTKNLGRLRDFKGSQRTENVNITIPRVLHPSHNVLSTLRRAILERFV